MTGYIPAPHDPAIDLMNAMFARGIQGFGAGLRRNEEREQLQDDLTSDMSSFENWLNAQRASSNPMTYGALGGIAPLVGPGMTPPVPFPAMQSPMGQQLSGNYMASQMGARMPLDPLQEAQRQELLSRARHYAAQASMSGLSGSDTTIAQAEMPDGTFHNVLVNKLTGETIRDLGLATPKDTGLPTATQEEKALEEIRSLRGQNELYDMTRPERVAQERIQTEQSRLNLLNAIETRDGQLPPSLRREKAQLELDQARVQLAQGKTELDMAPLKKNLLDAQIAETNAKVADAKGVSAKATTLRTEFNTSPVTKNYQTIQFSQRTMEKARAEADKGNRVAADQALGVMFQKMLDPTSVVRESEYARTPEGVAFFNRMEAILPKLASGGLQLTNDDRDALLTMATRALESAGEQFNEHYERYGTLADIHGVPRNMVFGNMQPFGVQNAIAPSSQALPDLSKMTDGEKIAELRRLGVPINKIQEAMKAQ